MRGWKVPFTPFCGKFACLSEILHLRTSCCAYISVFGTSELAVATFVRSGTVKMLAVTGLEHCPFVYSSEGWVAAFDEMPREYSGPAVMLIILHCYLAQGSLRNHMSRRQAIWISVKGARP